MNKFKITPKMNNTIILYMMKNLITLSKGLNLLLTSIVLQLYSFKILLHI